MALDRKLAVLIFILSAIVLLAGLLSEPCLGDECYHLRFAKEIFQEGRRVTFETMYASPVPPGYFFYSEPLWPALLALLWKITGGISLIVAQAYQALFFSFLVLFTYLLARHLYGERAGFLAALIVATVPAIAAFSMLFYLDIPGTCFSVFFLYLLVRKKFIWAGIILGLMFLVKRNTYFFFPAFILLIFFQQGPGFIKKLWDCIKVLIPVLLIVIWELLWRENNLKSVIIQRDMQLPVLATGTMQGMIHNIVGKTDLKLRLSEYLNSSFLNPADMIKYFGAAIILGLFLYFIYRKYEKKDLLLLVPVICYFLVFCRVFYIGSDIRYLLPIAPFLAILASKALNSIVKKRWAMVLLVFLCFLQFCFTVGFVWAQRRVPAKIKEGFAFIRSGLPADALYVYPGYVFLEQADRKFVWAGTMASILKTVFWSQNESEIKSSLKDGSIGYIVINKGRIYNDSNLHHFGGYPMSFVKRLPQISFLKLIFDNEAVSIWKANLS